MMKQHMPPVSSQSMDELRPTSEVNRTSICTSVYRTRETNHHSDVSFLVHSIIQTCCGERNVNFQLLKPPGKNNNVSGSGRTPLKPARENQHILKQMEVKFESVTPQKRGAPRPLRFFGWPRGSASKVRGPRRSGRGSSLESRVPTANHQHVLFFFGVKPYLPSPTFPFSGILHT